MKKRIIFFFALVLCFASTSFGQGGLSDAIITGTGDGRSIDMIDPYTGDERSVNAKLIVGTVDGDPTEFYCVDINRTIHFPDSCHHDSAIAESKIVYILNHYYPFNPDPPGELTNLDNEVAATQVAIWHFSDGVDANTVEQNSVRERALDIIADANANGGNTTVFTTMSILPDVDPDNFFIQTLDENGDGIAINNIQLSITQGTLSDYEVNTSLPDGNSPPVIVTGAASGAIIAAEASVVIPQGITYTCPGSQGLVLALPVIGTKRVTLDWGALPVEMSSFNALIDSRNVTLSWSTVSESNNAGFNIERMQVGNNTWTNAGNVTGSGTSNISHDYSFTDRNLPTGDYLYRLKQIDFNGNFEYHTLNMEVNIGVPGKFDLSQNYPNPFNPTTKINYDLPADGFVSIKVYNTSGKEVATLVSEFTTTGYHTVTFDASNLSSGIYYYKLETNNFSKVMKMALIK